MLREKDIENKRINTLCIRLLLYIKNHPEDLTPVYNCMKSYNDLNYKEYADVAQMIANPNAPSYQQLTKPVEIELVAPNEWVENGVKLEFPKIRENGICRDFEGWPEYAHNLEDLLYALGGRMTEDGNIIFDKKETFTYYPRVLRDDGMGYGIDEHYIVAADLIDSINTINIFVEKPDLNNTPESDEI